ncbi:MAG: glutamate--tRNA ligase [Candidatus Micrarchaeales archaeon]
MLKEEIKRKVMAYALKNSLEYGKADANVVLAKIAQFFKENIKELKIEVEKACEEVNRLSLEERKKLFEELSSEIQIKERKKEEKLLEAKNAVTRFLPEPNGYLHIGHAKALLLSYYVAKQNNGHFFLRFDDTNPETEKEEYVEAIKKDLEWLGVEYEKEFYSSDFIPILYDMAKKLIEEGKAYACTCSKEEIKENRKKMEECKCRSRSIEENIEIFEKMKKGELDENSAIIRLKANMKSENTVMRDPTILRIKKHFHFRQGNKYFVYPTYDFAVSIIDSLTGITHAIRSKEYELRDELYYYILDLLKLRKPKVIDISRLEIKNSLTSKRKIKELIKEKKILGFDDPRLLTLISLRKRGIQPKAIEEFVLSFGISKSESKAEIDKLLAINRKLIDAKAKRKFFVQEPFIRLKVNGLKEGKILVKNHPSVDLGKREIEYTDSFFIQKSDLVGLKKGDILKLKYLFCVKIEEITEEEAIAKVYEKKENEFAKVVQWVSKGVKARVLVPGDVLKEDGSFNENSLKEVKGIAEKSIEELKENEIVQFERFGFCNYIGNKTFVFSC